MTEETTYRYRVSLPILTTLEVFLSIPKSDVDDLDEEKIAEMEDHPAVRQALSEIENHLHLEVVDNRWKEIAPAEKQYRIPSDLTTTMIIDDWEILDSDNQFYEVELDRI